MSHTFNMYFISLWMDSHAPLQCMPWEKQPGQEVEYIFFL